MNPSWMTGRMPEGMYRHEHPDHFEDAKADTERQVRRELEMLQARNEDPDEAEYERFTEEEEPEEPGEDQGKA
jgi:hypothetical protein